MKLKKKNVTVLTFAFVFFFFQMDAHTCTHIVVGFPQSSQHPELFIRESVLLCKRVLPFFFSSSLAAAVH